MLRSLVASSRRRRAGVPSQLGVDSATFAGVSLPLGWRMDSVLGVLVGLSAGMSGGVSCGGGCFDDAEASPLGDVSGVLHVCCIRMYSLDLAKSDARSLGCFAGDGEALNFLGLSGDGVGGNVTSTSGENVFACNTRFTGVPCFSGLESGTAAAK